MKFYLFDDLTLEYGAQNLVNKIKNEKIKVGYIFKKMIEYVSKNKDDHS